MNKPRTSCSWVSACAVIRYLPLHFPFQVESQPPFGQELVELVALAHRHHAATDRIFRQREVGQADHEEIFPGDIDIQRTMRGLACFDDIQVEVMVADRQQELGGDIALEIPPDRLLR